MNLTQEQKYLITKNTNNQGENMDLKTELEKLSQKLVLKEGAKVSIVFHEHGYWETWETAKSNQSTRFFWTCSEEEENEDLDSLENLRKKFVADAIERFSEYLNEEVDAGSSPNEIITDILSAYSFQEAMDK